MHLENKKKIFKNKENFTKNLKFIFSIFPKFFKSQYQSVSD